MLRPLSRTGFAFALMMALLGDLPASAAHKGAAGRAGESIKFSPPGGVFTNGLVVQITSTGGSSSAIHYTLDGSEPTLLSRVYSTPIAISNTVLVRVRAAGGSNNIVVSSQTYVFIDSELAGFNSNLPLMIINSFGQELVKDEKTMVSARLIRPEGSRYSISGPAEFSGRALINIRGRASLRYPKRSYTIRPIDEQDDFLKISPLGLPSDSDWVLYAPYPDKTFIRDVLAYDLSNKMGQYAARTRFIELFVNETSERLSKTTYMGVYVLEEKIRRGKDRVNIEKLGPDDNAEPKITGGYIFKKDHEVDGDEGAQPNIGGFPGMQSMSSSRPGFPTGPGGFPGDPAGFLPAYDGPVRESSSSSSTTRRTTSSSSVTNRVGMIPEETDEFVSYRFNSSRSLSSSHERFVSKPHTNEFYYAYPEPDEITAAQRAWLMNHINKTETVLYGKNFLDRTNGYRAYIDPASFIDHHIIVELSKNVDGFRFSTFFHKDRGGKIKMGPVWDWNLSFGNANAKQGWLPEYWLWPQLNDKEYSWFRRLFEDPDFGQQYVDRWAQLRTNVLATTNVMAGINARTNLLQEAQVRNYERWPVLGRQVWPQYFVGNSYAEEVEFMKDWISKRLAWIDAQFVPAPEATTKAGQVALAASAGAEIVYTLDGLDPRLPGGGISPSATKYSAPLQTQPKAVLFARAVKDKRWSAPSIRSFQAQ